MGHLSQSLLEKLKSCKEDRGIMANLRCALVDSKRYRAWPLLARLNAIGSDFRSLAIQHVAGFYATHPCDETTIGDLGETCRGLLSEDEAEGLHSNKKVGPTSRRFQHLLAAEGEEVLHRTLRFVLMAKTRDVSVNYERLLDDFLQWPYNPDAVRVRWARSFWSPSREGSS